MAAHRGYVRRFSDAQTVPEISQEMKEPIQRRVSIQTIYDPKIHTIPETRGEEKVPHRWETAANSKPAFVVNNPKSWKIVPTPMPLQTLERNNNKETDKVNPQRNGEEAFSSPINQFKSVTKRSPSCQSTEGEDMPQWKKDLFQRAASVRENT